MSDNRLNIEVSRMFKSSQFSTKGIILRSFEHEYIPTSGQGMFKLRYSISNTDYGIVFRDEGTHEDKILIQKIEDVVLDSYRDRSR